MLDALAEEEQELEVQVESLDKTCSRYKMEITAEKTKLMTNSVNCIQRERERERERKKEKERETERKSQREIEIKANGQMLGTVTSFKYL